MEMAAVEPEGLAGDSVWWVLPGAAAGKSSLGSMAPEQMAVSSPC